MFGYIVANSKDLTEEQKQRYRACYCGLCKTLGERFGLSGRAALTYDMTFLVLLLSSLYEPETESGFERCTMHPAKPHAYWRNSITEYAADINVLLAYYNSLDNWRDDRSVPGLAAARILESRTAEIGVKYPRQSRAVQYSLSELTKLERSKEPGPDKASACFGTLMGELMVVREDHWSVILRRLGSSLGRFIYIMDAYEDLPKDRRSGSYNPLLSMDGPDLTDRCRDILTMLMADCARNYETLPIVTDADLLRNILYSGVWTRFVSVENRRRRESKERKNEP